MRTTEKLKAKNDELQAQNDELQAKNDKLQAQTKELETRIRNQREALLRLESDIKNHESIRDLQLMINELETGPESD